MGTSLASSSAVRDYISVHSELISATFVCLRVCVCACVEEGMSPVLESVCVKASLCTAY